MNKNCSTLSLVWNLTLPLTFDPPSHPFSLLVKEILKLPKLKIKTRQKTEMTRRALNCLRVGTETLHQGWS